MSRLPAPRAWRRHGYYEYKRVHGGTHVRVPQGDGEVGCWPGNNPSHLLVKELGPHGGYNYYIPLGKGQDDSTEARYVKKYEQYMKDLGWAFAKHVLNKDEALVAAEGTFDPDTCTLVSFPSGYKLFVHITGRPVASTLKDREHDGYLFGFTHLFRSPVEFFPHLRWLARGAPARECDCIYCDKSMTLEAIGRKYFGKSPRKRPAPLPDQREASFQSRSFHRAMRDIEEQQVIRQAQIARNHAQSAQRQLRRDEARAVAPIPAHTPARPVAAYADAPRPSPAHMRSLPTTQPHFPAPAPHGRRTASGGLPRSTTAERDRDERARIIEEARWEGSGPRPGSSGVGFRIRGAASGR